MVARPDYVNNVQGTITQTDNPLGLAIAGQGFFAVSQQTGQVNGIPTFNPQQYYTRAGDFQMDKNGYLVNSAGEFLNGWPVNRQTGVANQNTLTPIQVTQTVYNPVATTEATISANLPATPTAGTAVPATVGPPATPAVPIASDIAVYDALGSLHTVTLNWVQNSPANWSVQIQSLDDKGASTDLGTADVSFGTNGVAAGTIGDVTRNATDPGTVSTTPFVAGGSAAATLTFTSDFGSGPQNVTLNLGTYGQTNGVTQYAGTDYNLHGLTQNGVPPGAFASVTTQTGRQHRGELQQRPVARRSRRCRWSPSTARSVAAPGWPVVHRDTRFGHAARRGRRQQRRGQPRHPVGRELQRRYRHRVLPADRRAAGLLGQHQDGDHGGRLLQATIDMKQCRNQE